MTTDRNDAALAALAADVEDLGRLLRDVEKKAGQAADDAGAARRAVVDIANLVSEQRAATSSGGGGGTATAAGGATPWLVAGDTDEARQNLAELIGWLSSVYLHYDDATLAECWLWHPGVIAELMALRDVWVAAHYGESASPRAVMDWHDGYRPRAVKRIADTLADCHLERHAAGGDREYRPSRVAGTDMSGQLAAWWVDCHGSSAAPHPSPALLAESRANLAGRGDW